MRDVGSARLAEVDRLVEVFLTDRASLTTVELEELKRLVADGSVTLLDVRPALEYRQGHKPLPQSAREDIALWTGELPVLSWKESLRWR